MRMAWALALVPFLCACGDGGRTPPDGGAAPDSALRSESGVEAGALPMDSLSAGVIEATRVAVEGEGLRLFAVSSGSARPIPFGTSTTELLDVLGRVQGSAPVAQGENLDCGASYAAWADGLTLWFSDDRFVGWSLGEGTTVTTAAGVGPGSARADLDAAYDAEVMDSSLGVEFSAGDLAGLLESRQPDARITNLWAGVACVAR